MRFLHTSDWHLGRGFHGFSLRAEQEEMCDAVCSAVGEQGVDVVLIAGDVYDRALPPEWAVELLEETLGRLVDAGAQVIITAGNHDSAARLGFGRSLMRSSGVHIRSALEDSWIPVELTDENGPVLVYGVPYLEPQLHAAALGCERAHHTGAARAVTQRIRDDRAQRAPEAQTIVMAHLFAARGTASESERHIGAEAAAGERLDHHEETVGGLSVVPLEVFDGFDYTALGHLHGRQALTDAVRYSGSPLRFSFSEAEQEKGAWVYDTVEGSMVPLDWAIGRPLKRLSGTIEEVLSPETLEKWSEAYVQVKLTDDQRPEQAFQRVQEAYPWLASFSYAGAGQVSGGTTYSQKLKQARTDTEVVAGFLEHVRSRGPDEPEQQLIAEALQEARA
ncbi:exonuclease SbcCD subunit D [Nesterenkonia populi]|uniref:exonuclease SbcCD subunit D n=1 Tax=Nesterenkonia populi TaxID=1591087 RepID=UPI0011BD5548|nr:exonuclease SbcCD subunit D [Nesterenkonia populi]